MGSCDGLCGGRVQEPSRWFPVGALCWELRDILPALTALVPAGIGEKLVLPELLGSIRASSSLGTVKKQLNRVKQKKSLELPLSKEESERVRLCLSVHPSGLVGGH